jgi:hypothetical protein
VSYEMKGNWSAKSLLVDIAQSEDPFHALIDTGALVTGMDNEEVAEVLLEHLPQWYEGHEGRRGRRVLYQCVVSPFLHSFYTCITIFTLFYIRVIRMYNTPFIHI